MLPNVLLQKTVCYNFSYNFDKSRASSTVQQYLRESLPKNHTFNQLWLLNTPLCLVLEAVSFAQGKPEYEQRKWYIIHTSLTIQCQASNRDACREYLGVKYFHFHPDLSYSHNQHSYTY